MGSAAVRRAERTGQQRHAGVRRAGTTSPALFIFAGEHGDLSACNGSVAPITQAVAVGHVDGAVLKGLALVHSQFGPLLLAANFLDNRLEVFDATFKHLSVDGLFCDNGLPHGYAPFNVAEVGDRVFVTYAKQSAPIGLTTWRERVTGASTSTPASTAFPPNQSIGVGVLSLCASGRPRRRAERMLVDADRICTASQCAYHDRIRPRSSPTTYRSERGMGRLWSRWHRPVRVANTRTVDMARYRLVDGRERSERG